VQEHFPEVHAAEAADEKRTARIILIAIRGFMFII
jgi:hypothetical protein